MQSEGDSLMNVDLESTRFPPREMVKKFSKDKITVDVIIPSKTCVKTVFMNIRCIQSLRDSEDDIKFNVVMIESGAHFVDMGQDDTILYPEGPFCYNKALNMGLSATTNDWVVLANNDLIFKKNWMHEIIIANNLRKDIESFSPWNDMYDWHSRYLGVNPQDIIEGYRIGVELTGWCIVARRSIFDRVKLNENVNFWYSDNVYADELIAHKVKHALVTGSKVDHITSQTHVVSPEEAEQARQQYLGI